MEVYWRLASTDASEREAATAELVRSLLLQQQDHGNSEKNLEGSEGKTEKPDKKAKSESSEKQETRARRKRKGVHREQTGEEVEGTNTLAEEKGTGDKGEGSTASTFNASHSNGNMLDGVLADEYGLQNCSPSVQYALRRLVRGVASSRECARQGFAMALASLLEALPLLKIGSVLKLIHKSLEVTSSMKGQEKRDGLLGQLFALGAVVRSGRMVVNFADTEDAKEIAEKLLSLAKRKAFLREPAITLLMQFFEMLPPGGLQDSILNSPLLQEMLCVDPGNANADTLLLALRLHKQLPSSVVESCPLLPSSKNTQAIFEPSHLLSLVSLLKDSSSCHPRLHSIWSYLVELLFQESSHEEPSKKKKKGRKNSDVMVKTTDQRVIIFWKLVVDDSLLPSSHERKYLAMELLQLLLPKLSASCAYFILSKTLVRCLLDILAAKENLLYKYAQTCLAPICEWAKTDEERIVTVVISLQHASHGKFDALSRTKTVKELLSALKSEKGWFLLYNKLVELFNGEEYVLSAAHPVRGLEGTDGDHNVGDDKEKDDTGSIVKALETQRCWVLEQIFSFAREISDPDLRWSLQKETLIFLTANALFVAPMGSKTHLKELEEEFQFPELPLSENTRNLCLARLQSLLLNVSLVVSAGEDKKHSSEKASSETTVSSDLRFRFLDLCDTFDSTLEISRVQPVSEDAKDAIDSLRSCLSQLRSLVTEASNEQTQKVRAMCSLLMQLLLQSATTGVNDITPELILCCKKAFGEQIKVDTIDDDEEEETEEPLFMDVLVEILLSLLAQSSASIRSAAEQVFRAFCGDLTKSNMLSLLRVVKKQLNPGRRVATTPLDTGDSDEEQILEIEESDDDIDDNDDDDDDDDDDEEDAELLDESKQKGLHEADLDTENDGKEAIESTVGDHEMSKDSLDLEDDSASDMDDEAMFKIDVHLANLLKQRRASNEKGEGKDAQTQLLHFKFRVLSLLEYFFQKKGGSPLCLVSLPHLLQALVMSSSAGGNPQLAEKISSILQGKLFKSKDYPKGPEVDKTVVESLLERCMKLALRSKIKRVGQVLQSCSLWLMKVMHGQPFFSTKESEDLEMQVKNALNDFFYQRKCCLKASFFRELFTRFPGIALASLGVLLESCRKPRTEYLQQEALQLVNFVLHVNISKKNGLFRESLLQNLPAMSELLVDLIEKPPSNKVKKSEIRRFCVFLLKTVAQELPEKPVKKQIGKAAYDLCISHFGASITDGIVKRKEVNLVGVPGNTSKKQSTLKSSQG